MYPKNFLYICIHKQGGLAQLARALAWHAKRSRVRISYSPLKRRAVQNSPFLLKIRLFEPMEEPLKPWLFGLTLTQLSDVATELGMPRYAAPQLATWLYARSATSLEEMTNLSKRHRAALAERYQVGGFAFAGVQCSSDGTKKYLFPTLKVLTSNRPIFPIRIGRHCAFLLNRGAAWDVVSA